MAHKYFITRRDLFSAFLIAFAGFVLYLYSLLPTTGYIDSPIYTNKAYFLKLGIQSIDHPLFMILARLFTLLPVGPSIAYRVNLVSAFFGGITLFFLYLLCRARGIRPFAAALSSIAFATSHIFWWLSTEAEVYTLNTAFLAATLFFVLRYHLTGRVERLLAAVFLLGLSLTNHQLMVLFIPPLLIFLIPHYFSVPGYSRKTARGALLLLFFAVGFSPYLVLLVREIMSWGVPSVLERAAGGDFSKYIFAVRNPLEFLFVCTSFTVIALSQFHLFTIVCVAGIRHAFRNDRRFSMLLVLYAALHTIFVINYQVPDRPFFYLPTFLVLAIFTGEGIDSALRWSRTVLGGRAARLAVGAGMVLMTLINPLQHRLTLHIVKNVVSEERLDSRLERFRHSDFLLFMPHVPGRDDIAYYLNPVKRGNYSADYYREVMESAPPGSVIVDDWYHGYSIMKDYYQEVTGVRQDLEFIRWFVTFGGTHRDQMVIMERIFGYLDEGRGVYLATEEYPASALLDSLNARGGTVGARAEGLLYRLEYTDDDEP